MNYSGDRKVLKYARYSYKMDNMDDPETNAKISDSAYSNSCSNSQSRRSRSSKSTHSGSNSSGSSGYGGKASTSGSSNTLGQPPKKDKEAKKKKLQTEVNTADAVSTVELVRPAEPDPITATPKEPSDNVNESAKGIALPEQVAKDMEISTLEPNVANKEVLNVTQPVSSDENYVSSLPSSSNNSDGFSFVVSMHNGVIIQTSDAITSAIGFPKDIWAGRFFVDFLHPKDHNTFSSLSRNWLIFPKFENEAQCQEEGYNIQVSRSTMLCRIRRYKSLNLNYGVKDTMMTFTPFLLKFFFKGYCEDDPKEIHLHIQAFYFYSAFNTANELITKPTSFMFRHAANGILEYIDPESIPYLGYLPQDIKDKSALHLFHPDDLPYLKQIYERIVKEETVISSKPYRLMTQNGDYITVETEWSTVINEWSMKLEFVIAKHHIIEGPANPDVFESPSVEKSNKISDSENNRIQAYRDRIIRIMNEVQNNTANSKKEVIGERCQNLVSFIETLIEETPKQEDELRPQMQDTRQLSYYERDSVMLGGISPHHDSDSKSSVETLLSYNQLNYNENMQRYFESQVPHCYDNNPTFDVPDNLETEIQQPSPSHCFSPMAQNSDEFNNPSPKPSTSAVCHNTPPPSDVQYKKLTENMMHKHNAEMEKELVKVHRESRSSKGDRAKASNASWIHTREHLARCNAVFLPTSAEDAMSDCLPQKKKSRGVKRTSDSQYDDNHMQKHHCPSPKEPHCGHYPGVVPVSFAPAATHTSPSVVDASQWATPQYLNSHNVYGYTMPNQTQMMPHILVPSKTPITSTTSVAPNTVIVPSPSPITSTLISETPRMVPRHCYTPAMLGTYEIPGTPGMQGMPSTSRVQEMPSITGRQGLSGTSGMQGMPSTSRVQEMPSITGRQGLSGTSGMQGMHGIPVMQGVPGTSGMQGVLRSPGMQRMPCAPLLHGMPDTSEMQGIPSISVMQEMPGNSVIQGGLRSPTIQRMPDAPLMHGMPCTSGMQGMPGISVIQGMPGNSVIQGVPRSPIIQRMPGAPLMHGVPGTSGMQGVLRSPEMQRMPCAPLMHGMPDTSGMQEMSGISVIQGMPGVSSMQEVPGSQGMQGVPGSQGMQRMPSATLLQGMPGPSGIPGGPVIHGISGLSAGPPIHGVPGMPVIPRMRASLAAPAVAAMPGVSGLYPVYYAPPAGSMPTTSIQSVPTVYQPFEPSLPYMVHRHPVSMVYPQPYVYSTINPQMYPMQQNVQAEQPMHYTNALDLSTSNYEQCSGQNYEFLASSSTSHEKSKNTRTSDENTDKTDGESSYSSFYSSFVRTDSGSADDSCDQNKNTTENRNKFSTKTVPGQDSMSFQSSTDRSIPFWKRNTRKMARRRMEAPWNQGVEMTSDLVYKYQLSTLPTNEVLEDDKKKIKAMDCQPTLVNDQLNQLYLDMQMQGVTQRLTLEEGITSSSSSGEESTPTNVRVKRKREYNKLSIIHEENAPLPPPGTGFLVSEGPPDEDIDPTVYSFVHPLHNNST